MKEKYSVGEYERRFLLDALPNGATNPRSIVDLYLQGTRLRLRKVEAEGSESDWKLGHKRRVESDDPTAIRHTSMYLNEPEFSVLAQLPADRLAKTRWTVNLGGERQTGTGAVDVFEDALVGLILLEVDVGEADALDDFVPPSWAGIEITRNEAFTGGRLVTTSAADLVSILANARSPRP